MTDPLLLNFYSPEDEIIKTYSRNGVLAGVMKRAMQYSKELQGKNTDDIQMNEKLLDALGSLIVELYGEQFTLDELYKHSYFDEWFPLITKMYAKAGQKQQEYFPTVPQRKNRKRK